MGGSRDNRFVTIDDQHSELANAWTSLNDLMDCLPSLIRWDGVQYMDLTDMADRVRGLAIHLDSAVLLASKLRYDSALALLRTGLEQSVPDWLVFQGRTLVERYSGDPANVLHPAGIAADTGRSKEFPPLVTDATIVSEAAIPIEVQQVWWEIALAVVTAAGTLAAAVVPFVLFLLERRSRKDADARAALADQRREQAEHGRWEAEERYRREELARSQARDEAAAAAERSRYATGVSVWIEGPPVQERGGWITAPRSAFTVFASNLSGSPVFEVDIRGVERYARTFEESDIKSADPMHPLAGTDLMRTTNAEVHWGVIPPTGSQPLERALSDLLDNRDDEFDPRYHLNDFEVQAVIFTDVNGRHWKRSGRSGDLREWDRYSPENRSYWWS